MTHRERIMAALNHEQPDRVPMDLGGTLASTVIGPAYTALRAELNLPVHEATESMRYARLAVIEEDILAALDLDVIHAPRAFGTGETIKNISENSFIDEWGVQWHKLQKGHYYVKQAPFEIEATPQAVENFKWPNPKDMVNVEGLAEAIKKLRDETDYAISIELQGRVMSIGQFLRGFENWMADLALNESFVQALLERTTQIQMEVNHIILDEVGDLLDIVYTADDLGGQNGPLLSPATAKRLFNPHLGRLWGHIRENTSAKLLHHCCGSIYPFISDFIELGVQALNPIQVSAKNMDPAKLKSQFGKDMCFWGGVDTRQVMPRGTTQDVRDEVALRIEQMGPGGGYVLAAVHNLQPEVPAANIVELFRAGRKLGKYPPARSSDSP
ncbi:MAG: uroporphyrinogen decarboxylase family protein [Planctomycetota bacterium]